MRSPATPSVDQLLVLLTVAEAGSFTAAAKRLGRATSAISYAVDTLEQQLGLSLFDRGTTRKPKLTQHGEAIVSEARTVAHSIETLRARVRGFLDELEPEVSLAVDSMLPGDRLTTLLCDFHAQFPTVPVRLLVQTLGGVERVVRSGLAGIGVGSLLHIDMTGFRRIDITGVRIIPNKARFTGTLGGMGTMEAMVWPEAPVFLIDAHAKGHVWAQSDTAITDASFPRPQPCGAANERPRKNEGPAQIRQG